MQFLVDGPDIPDELLNAQEQGDTVFVCGAGVSRGAELPGFKGLVDDVYQALGERPEGHPAEAAHYPGALDRTLFALQTRMGGAEARTIAQARAAIVEAVQARLAPPAGGVFRDHLNILRLSRDAEMRPRVVTTNFDTLFERAWRDDGRDPLPSRAAADMPGPGTADFFGVLHLHGRLADTELGLARTDLVLNSAEFGEAYLRSGWASRYVYDLARASTLVIVGYGAEDPPVRYILETLSSDRTRFRDLGEIYAFTPVGTDLPARAQIEAMWTSQGITPICYEAPNGGDHSALYGSLAAWADYAADSKSWRQQRAADLLAKAPADLAPEEWAWLSWALGRGDAYRILAGANPEPNWLAPLRGKGLLASSKPAAWIEKRLDERPMFEAVLQSDILDPTAAADLHFSLASADLDPDLDQAWRLLLKNRSATRHMWDDGWFELRRRMNRGDNGLDARRRVVGLLTPKPKAMPVFRWPEEVEVDRGLMDVRYHCAEHADFEELLDLWPREQDAALMRPLVRALEDALDEASDYGFTGGGFDRASFQVKSVSSHAQDSLREGFYPLVRTIAALLERMADGGDVASATAAAELLRRSPYVLAQRVFVHALSLPGLYAASEVAEVLLAFDDESFWVSELRREVMRLMAERWDDFTDEARARLEVRLEAGPPRHLYTDRAEMAEQVTGVIERETFLRLGRLENAGPGLTAVGQARIEAFRADHPRWEQEVDERADFSNWSEMVHGEQGDPDLLEDVPTEDLVERAAAIAEGDPMGQGEIWRLFVASDRPRAFEALTARAQAGEWPAEAWIPYFWGLSDFDDPDLERRTVAFLNQAGTEAIGPFGFAVTGWMIRRGGLPAVDQGQRLELWDRLLEVMVGDQREAESDGGDREFDVLNRTPGHLVRLLHREIRRLELPAGERLPAPFLERLERLAALQGVQGEIAVAALARYLPEFHRWEPEWVEATLIPFVQVAHPWAPANWTQLAKSPHWGSERLLEAIKPAFLVAFGQAERFSAAREGLVYHLMRLAFARNAGAALEAEPSFAEMKTALASADPEFRRTAAYHLFRAMEDAPANERPKRWREAVGPVFSAIWPMQPGLQGGGSAFHFVSALLRAGEAFPEAVPVVAPALIAAVKDDRDVLFLNRDEQEGLLATYPEAAVLLLDAVVSRGRAPRRLGALLDRLVEAGPNLRKDLRFERLLDIARREEG